MLRSKKKYVDRTHENEREDIWSSNEAGSRVDWWRGVWRLVRKSMVIGCDDSGGRGSRNSSEEAAVSIATVERL